MANIKERYAKATISSNLRCDDKHFQTDVLAVVALGSKFGSSLLRLKYANDISSYRRVLDEWETEVGAKARKDAWPQHLKFKQVAKASLEHWMNDLCRSCGGKCFVPVEDVPTVLSDNPCPDCAGTGTAKVTCDKRDLRYIEDMINVLDEYMRQTAGAVMRKLSRDMDL